MEAWAQCPTVCERHFQIYLLEKGFVFWFIFQWNLHEPMKTHFTYTNAPLCLIDLMIWWFQSPSRANIGKTETWSPFCHYVSRDLEVLDQQQLVSTTELNIFFSMVLLIRSNTIFVHQKTCLFKMIREISIEIVTFWELIQLLSLDVSRV